MPSFSRHDGQVPARDENRDGHIDERDERYAAGMDERAAADRDRDATAPDRDRDATAADRDATAADRAATARAMSARGDVPRSQVIHSDKDGDGVDDRATAVDTDGDGKADTVVDRRTETPVAPAGPRPRASFMATLSLIFGVAGAAFVLSGVLAGYGIALGAIAVVLSIFGISATRRRHVSGKTDALLGFGIGAAAIVIGILAMTGSFSWPTTDASWAERLREWLDAQFVDRF
jgi:hypothetical protein